MKTTKLKTAYAIALLFALSTAQAVLAFYDPNLGRWANRDPIGEAGGINLYNYVFNDPISLIDPYGMDIFRWPSPLPNWPRATRPQRLAQCKADCDFDARVLAAACISLFSHKNCPYTGKFGSAVDAVSSPFQQAGCLAGVTAALGGCYQSCNLSVLFP